MINIALRRHLEEVQEEAVKFTPLAEKQLFSKPPESAMKSKIKLDEFEHNIAAADQAINEQDRKQKMKDAWLSWVWYQKLLKEEASGPRTPKSTEKPLPRNVQRALEPRSNEEEMWENTEN